MAESRGLALLVRRTLAGFFGGGALGDTDGTAGAAAGGGGTVFTYSVL